MESKISVRSQSDASTIYTVYVGEKGPTFCTCPGFKYQRGRSEFRKPCKHMRAISAAAVVAAVAS